MSNEYDNRSIMFHMIGSTPFLFACKSGNSEIVKIFIHRSYEFHIDLNAKSDSGWTSFHIACGKGYASIVEILIVNAESYKLDLTVKEKDDGKTGFQVAEYLGKSDIVSLIRRKMPSIAF